MPRKRGKNRKNEEQVPHSVVNISPSKFIQLEAPNGMKFTVQITNPEIFENSSLKKVQVQSDAYVAVINFLDQVSQVLFQSTFQCLVFSQRSIVWNCVKQEWKQYCKYFLEALILTVDSSFPTSSKLDSKTFNIEPRKLLLFASKIFHIGSYIRMTVTERNLLQNFVIKTNGVVTQWINETNTQIKGIINRVNQLGLWPDRGLLRQSVVDIDKKLVAICEKDTDRLERLRDHRAMLDYESHFGDLTLHARAEVKEQIELEYKVRLLSAENKDPFTLDEAAYLAYLIPYQMLSPFAQYCAAR